ncbi:sensor histidine kinase [Streptacidiphilus cavernicola]|uniref:histidine kinase n=1 Tax=Streptacidiphilus cavernicola TaxID=3342716 RepID=A0ABV6W2R4_9ACTN
MRQPRGSAPVGPDRPDGPSRPRPAHAGPPADERDGRSSAEQAVPAADSATVLAVADRRGPDADAPATASASATAAAPVEPPGPAGPFWRRLRPRTVRARVVALLMVPVVSLMALWGFATVTTAQDVTGLVRLKQVDALLLTPVDRTVSALQAERTAAAVYVAAPTPGRADALAVRGRATDSAVAALNDGIAAGAADGAGLGAELPSRLAAFRASAAGLGALRGKVGAGTVGWSAAMADYDGVVASVFGIDSALSGMRGSTATAAVGSDPRVLLELARARDLLAREDAAVQSGLLAGRMTGDQYQEFTGSAFARQALAGPAAADLRPADAAAYAAVERSPGAAALLAMENAVRAGGAGGRAVRGVSATGWARTAGDLQSRYAAVESAAGAGAGAGADAFRLGVFTSSGAAVLFGLLAVLLSLLISVRIGRRLVVELVDLRSSALDLANHRLPEAMRRLRAGEEVDVDAEAPLLEAGEDELGQVGAALNTVQRSALQAAVERAEVLSGVSGVFVNLARRSQVLVHRQLALLDAMERRTEDPGELADLFRLDHLTTRMRRHAEGLIILSGAVPGRAWRRSVPLLDVVRSAVAEVEEFSRAEVRPLPRVSVVGGAVADLTHLVAELVENAATFSPPHTKVVVTGERVGTGYALDIEDRGLGMSGTALAEANRRIAEGQQADLFDSNQLGLFVVSRLARRLGVRVSLRTSPYGGTTAVLLLPTAMLSPEGAARSKPGAKTVPKAVPRPERQPVSAADPHTGVRAEPSGVPSGERGAGTGGELRAEPWGEPRWEPRAVPLAKPGRGSRSEVGSETGPESEPRRAGWTAPEPAAEPAPATASSREPRRRPHGPSGGGLLEAVPSPAAAATAGAEQDELPRRVRQANLAARLREAPDAMASPGTGAGTPPGGAGARGRDRSPDSVRATMSAMADGWTRGRTAAPGRRPTEPPTWPPEPAAPSGPRAARGVAAVPPTDDSQ